MVIISYDLNQLLLLTLSLDNKTFLSRLASFAVLKILAFFVVFFWIQDILRVGHSSFLILKGSDLLQDKISKKNKRPIVHIAHLNLVSFYLEMLNYARLSQIGNNSWS